MAALNLKFESVERPTETFVKEATDIFASVMAADPSAAPLTGGNLALVAKLGEATIRPLALCEGIGRTYTARDETGALIGYAMFVPPGKLLFSEEEHRKLGVYDYVASLSPEGQKYYAEIMGKVVPKLVDEVFKEDNVAIRMDWCNMAMVRADYQGKGVAKTLIAMEFAEAAKTGATVGVGTTNQKNVVIYEKIGFQCAGERTVSSPWGDWTVWYFSKETKL